MVTTNGRKKRTQSSSSLAATAAAAPRDPPPATSDDAFYNTRQFLSRATDGVDAPPPVAAADAATTLAPPRRRTAAVRTTIAATTTTATPRNKKTSSSSIQTPVVPRNIIGSVGESSSVASTLSPQTPMHQATPKSNSISTATSNRVHDWENTEQQFQDDYEEQGDGTLSDEDNEDEEEGLLGFETDANLKEVIEERQEIRRAVLAEFRDRDQTNSDSILEYQDGTRIDEEDLPSFIPETHHPHKANESTGTPAFEDVDNPGNWSSYCFKPVLKNGRYSHHKMPGGALPIPRTPGYEGSTRKINGWDVDYGGTFDKEDNLSRHDASFKNIYPKEREGYLDVGKLERFGVTRARLLQWDALLIFQLLLPMIDTNDPRKTIANDGRRSFYEDVANFTNQNKANRKQPSYGHKCADWDAKEIVNFDGILFFHGASGGGHDLHRLWNDSEPKDCRFQPKVKRCMYPTRFLQTKKYLKYNNNLEDELKKHKTPDEYDRANKFSLVYDVLIFNTRYFTKKAPDDLIGDETTAGYGGCGEYVGNLRGKIVSRGVQSALLMGKNNRLYGCIHRHKSNPKCEGTWPGGASEIRQLVEKYIADSVGEGDDCLWSQKPHIVADNYFTHELLLEWLGQNGYGYLGTAARNKLIKDMNLNYFHRDKMTVNSVNKAARFAKPIVFSKVKTYKEKRYRRVHISFQSTGTTNIATVNSLSNGKLYARKKVRGRGGKYIRIIEMNMGRDIYLHFYGAIDTIDAVIKKAKIDYRCWRYFHKLAQHGKALALASTFSFYKEIISGSLKEEWKMTGKAQQMDFHQFQQRLGEQMMEYDPKVPLYHGDNKTRRYTSTTIASRTSRNTSVKRRKVSVTDDGTGDTTSEISLTAVSTAIGNGRLNDTLLEFERHVGSKTTVAGNGKKKKNLEQNCFMCSKK